ncbi:uncharacterized protein LOC134196887 [Corticium candelabrum]|uniref:uncharacterized protein LOC134196887 n=1 Tax=Corticium candelabrum TaxID=121492 RepID=UPI002E27294C|nr:uncharacterized protein LOC134196887 [Corticium candelabrum]
MGRPKRVAIGRRTSAAKRIRNSRAEETAVSRELRLAMNNDRTARARELETSEQRQERLSANREITARARQEETPEQRQARMSADREGTARARQEETPDQRQARLRDKKESKPTVERWKRRAFNYDQSMDYSGHADVQIGAMSKECQYYHALKWVGEAPGMCCSNGKFNLPLITNIPEPLKSLLLLENHDSKQFVNNIRKYNSAFQMTSFGCTERVCLPGFMPTFKVQGQVYHRIGDMQPQSGENPEFLQIYFMGHKQEQAETRCRAVPGVKIDIILSLQEMLHNVINYVASFKTALEKMDLPENRIVIRPDKAPTMEHPRRFNAPLTDEVAVLIVGQQFQQA